MMDSELSITFVRLTVALVAGGLIGLERTYHGSQAGFRTHILVCVASAVLMLLTVFQINLLPWVPVETIRIDPTRMAQGIMTGIGFLGAGLVMKEKLTIRGLTSAASIWITAGIGIIIGMGMFYAAFYTTILVVGALSIFRWVEDIVPTLQYGKLTIQTLNKEKLSEKEIRVIVSEKDITCTGVSYYLEDDGKYFKYEMTVRTHDTNNFYRLVKELNEVEVILEFSLEPASN